MNIEADECAICGEDLIQRKWSVVKTEKGKQSLIAASVTRDDGLKEKFINMDQIKVHQDCRKEYTHPTSIEKVKKRKIEECLQDEEALAEEGTLRRSKVSTFNFKLDCFFCGKEASEEKEKKKPAFRRSAISQVSTIPVKSLIEKRAEERNDEWGNVVLSRINIEIDLVASEGRYHTECFAKFFSNRPKDRNPGRPSDPRKTTCFQELCDEIEADEDCQFSITELLEEMQQFTAMGLEDEKEAIYSKRSLKRKLKNYFGKRAFITHLPGRDSVLSLRENVDKVIYDKWYTEMRATDPDEERMRIVQMAASIVREDIRSMVFDTGMYTVGHDLGNADSVIPKTLTTFMGTVLKSASDISKRKQAAISEAIITACRPRSFVSPILLSTGVFLHRHYASRNLIDVLSSLGFCVSYAEVQRCEFPLQEDNNETEVHSDAFVQFVFDNADVNIRTLDGHSTFHNMGGIQCSTPKIPFVAERQLRRVKILPKISQYDFSKGRMKVISYDKPARNGLQSVTLRHLEISDDINCMANCVRMDLLWLFGLILSSSSTPSWNGYMEKATSSSGPYELSDVIILPFIDLSPSDPSCIFTALMFAAEQCRKAGQKTCFVTFDQPLYAKATEIVASSEVLQNVTVRLGGFHLLMSYLGSVGHIMSGSGLQQLWSTLYSKQTIEHMLSGHAYSRSLRGHMLSFQALGCLLFAGDDILKSHLEELLSLHKQFLDNDISCAEVESNQLLIDLQKHVEERYKEEEVRSRTGKLWVQYMRLVGYVLNFLRAERSGNWDLYVLTIKEMIPIFHAAGHLQYAKSATLYLHQMLDLQSHMDATEFHRMTTAGGFSVRRSDKFWCGVSPDLAIEQGLMRSMKTSGGLTRGRGITDSTLANWINALPKSIPFCDRLEQFCGLYHSSSEQHVELRESRKKRDDTDRLCLSEWLVQHNPFSARPADQLVSISTGLIANETVNCDRAVEIGKQLADRIVGKSFVDAKLKRSDKVKPLSSMSRSIDVRGESVIVDTQQLFSRIVLIKGKEEFSELLTYELAPHPPALFDDVSMRKTQKSSLKNIISSLQCSDSNLPENTVYVIDGGYLLHKCVWQGNKQTFEDITNKYVSYVTAHYGINSEIIFDGYCGPPNTKFEEQQRRSSLRTSADLSVEPHFLVTASQEEFLGNTKNKAQFVNILTRKFRENGFVLHQAEGDADTLIVSTALSLTSRHDSVTIVATDTDVLTITLARSKPADRIFILHPSTPKTAATVFDIQAINAGLGDMKNCMLFLHSMTGCDTTSAIFGKGKKQGFNLLHSNLKLREHVVTVFNHPSSNPLDITSAGEAFLLALYKATKSKSLNDLRYVRYAQSAGKRSSSKAPFDLSKLPPSCDAAEQHSLRVYLQVQAWLGNDLPPGQWGWQLKGAHLVPIRTRLPPAPQELLHLVSCTCKKGCLRGCQCRLGGFSCSVMCATCQGISCSNVVTDLEDSISDDERSDNLE